MVNINSPPGAGKKFQTLPKGDEKKYEITIKSEKSVYLQAVIMINPATGWIEIGTAPSAWVDLVANQVELAWLPHYPLPNKLIVDRRNEFLAKFREMIINDKGITVKPITSRKPQVNVRLERVH